MGSSSDFGKWRARLWPVHSYELKKLVPMVIMFYLILFNYTILRDTKDTLVVTGAGSGAEIIPFLKLWINVPFAIGFTIIYSKMTNIFRRNTVFYLVVLFFVFFLFFFHSTFTLIKRCFIIMSMLIIYKVPSPLV